MLTKAVSGDILAKRLAGDRAAHGVPCKLNNANKLMQISTRRGFFKETSNGFMNFFESYELAIDKDLDSSSELFRYHLLRV